MDKNDKIRHSRRLFIEADLAKGQSLVLKDEQAHYLMHVLRAKPGEAFRVFNGRDGEWLARVASVSKRSLEIAIDACVRKQGPKPTLTLCAAPIKKAHYEYMLEKATELGVGSVCPILTERTQIRDVNIERARSIAIEAAEQSERLDIPEVNQPVTLTAMIAAWTEGVVPLVCAELGEAAPAHDALKSFVGAKHVAAIVTGPEGGFTEAELEALRKLPGAVFIRLGPRILRADTAAIAALTLWQAFCGDWR